MGICYDTDLRKRGIQGPQLFPLQQDWHITYDYEQWEYVSTVNRNESMGWQNSLKHSFVDLLGHMVAHYGLYHLFGGNVFEHFLYSLKCIQRLQLYNLLGRGAQVEDSCEISTAKLHSMVKDWMLSTWGQGEGGLVSTLL